MSLKNAPRWGTLVYHADQDVLSYAWLLQGNLITSAFFHASQAMEKYLKALYLATLEPEGRTRPDQQDLRRLKDHNLVRLATRVAAQFPHYSTPEVQAKLEDFSRIYEAARYPWVEKPHTSGYNSGDAPLISELLCRLRSDLPIVLDDYPLGIFVRGFHHNHPEHALEPLARSIYAGPLAAARRFIPDLIKMVRW